MPDAIDIISHSEPEPDENPWVHGAPSEEVIEMVAYDPDWPATFDKLAGAITNAVGAVALRLDHIGSTSVPGLAAKPVIDMNLTVKDPPDEKTYVPALEEMAYDLIFGNLPGISIAACVAIFHVSIYMSSARIARKISGTCCSGIGFESIPKIAIGTSRQRKALLRTHAHVMDYNLGKQPVIRDIYARAFKAAGLI